jgi:hypothetical protein
MLRNHASACVASFGQNIGDTKISPQSRIDVGR